MSELKLRGIRKQYEGVARMVIPDLDLTIPSGQMAVLVGPSGCGKSTTLRMVAGLEEPTAGTIEIGGRDVTHVAPSDRDIAMVFQSYALYPHMSVFENMAFGLRIKKMPDAEIRTRVNAAAESLGLTPYLERRPKALSGGQRQRVAIGRAVVRAPKVFLFDEPLSNLDAKLRGEMRREIARIHQASATTSMYVTHDQIEAMTLADMIVVLKDGVVQQIGSPVDIYERPANRFVGGFFGTPTMNFLSATLAQTGDHRSAKGPGFEIPLAASARALRPAAAAAGGDQIVVGIRPERLSLAGSDDAVSVAGSVAMREVLGAEVVLHVESAAGPLTVRSDASSAPRTGDTVTVWLDPSAVHLFDGATEMRLWKLAALAATVAALTLGACEHPRGVVLWHAYNGVEREALEETAQVWNREHPDQPLELVAVPYGAFADKLTSAIPGGNGPDLFIYPQDRIGDWANAGVIEPIEFWVDDAKADRFSSEAVAAMAYQGSLWGMPLAVKSLALFYRTDLTPTPPASTNELVALAPAMKTHSGYAVAYANVDLYGHAPWLHGHGGRVLDDQGQLAIASPEAAAAMQFARELVATGAAPPQAEGPLVATLFNEGKAATVISGPWFIADIAQGVPWKVATLPIVSATGKHAAPFLGAEGILMSARAKDKDTAFAVMDALTSDAAATIRAERARQVVPNTAAYLDPEVAADPALSAFRAQLAHSVPMPTGPAMRMVWTPYKTALGEVLSGRAAPVDQLLGVEREVQGYLAGPSGH